MSNFFRISIDTVNKAYYNICMFETIIMTLFTGMFTLIIFGSIALWILTYLCEQFEEMKQCSPLEVVIILAVCFGIGLVVA